MNETCCILPTAFVNPYIENREDFYLIVSLASSIKTTWFINKNTYTLNFRHLMALQLNKLFRNIFLLLKTSCEMQGILECNCIRPPKLFCCHYWRSRDCSDLGKLLPLHADYKIWRAHASKLQLRYGTKASMSEKSN